MLRYSFLPSDHHPMVLMLGEASDLLALGWVLRRFSKSPGSTNLGDMRGIAPSDTQIMLTSTGGRLGMYPLSLKDKSLRWTLDQPTAGHFAELIEQLAEQDRKSGSERLACGHFEEIPVKVSRGEFTDDYLIFERQVPQRSRRLRSIG